MLLIQRKPGESFTVGEAKITIIHATKNQVRIGIEAPAELAILRSELMRNKDAETDATRAKDGRTDADTTETKKC